MNDRVQKTLISPMFILGLSVLLINDLYLKQQFGNFWTGKLSDFAGLFIFPFFVSVFFPKRRLAIYLFTAFLFVFWKSRFSQPAIDLVNSFQAFGLGRTIDYSDLLALTVLPFSYKYTVAHDRPAIFPLNSFKRVLCISVVLISVFAFTATSFEQERHVSIDRVYTVKLSVDEFERKLKNIDSIRELEVEKETDAWPENKYPNVHADPSGYYLHFKISEKYCESSEIRFFASFHDEGSKISMNTPQFEYWCSQKPTEQDNQRLISIFERKIIQPVTGDSGQ